MTDLEIVVVRRETYYHEVEWVRGLENLAAAVLLFHRGGPWTDDDRQASTKSLCDFARKLQCRTL